MFPLLQKLLSGTTTSREETFASGTGAFRTLLNEQTEIRLFVDSSPNLGHQGSTITLMRQLIGRYGYRGEITVVYDPYDDTAQRLARLVTGYVAGSPDPVDVGGASVRFIDWTKVEDLPWVLLGFTGGADPDHAYNHTLHCHYFLRLQPYLWPRPQGIEYFWDKGPGTRTKRIDLEWQGFFGPSLRQRASYVPPVTELPWDWYSDNGPEAQRGRVRNARVLLANLGGVHLCPIYGVRPDNQTGRPPETILMRLAVGILTSQARYRGSAVVVNFDNAMTDEAWNAFEALMTGEPTPEEQKEALLLADQEDTLRMLRRWGRRKDVERQETVVRDTTNRLRALERQTEFLKELRTGERVSVLRAPTETTIRDTLLALQSADDRLCIVNLGQLPQELYQHVWSRATLPGVFEGAATAQTVLNLGVPYLHLLHLSLPGTTVLYPTVLLATENREKAARILQSGANALVHRDPGTLRKAAEYVGEVIVDYYTNRESILPGYIAGVRDFYSDPINDKLALCLCVLQEVVRRTRMDQRVLRAAAAPGAEEGRLEAFLAALQASTTPQKRLDLIPGALPDGAIAAFYRTLLPTGAGLALDGVEIVPVRDGEGTLERIDVQRGTTDGFGVAATVEASFGEEGGMLTSRMRVRTADTLLLDGAPWIPLENAGFVANVNEGTVPPTGAVTGTLRGTALELGVQLPVADGRWLVSGSFAEGSYPGLASFFQLAGGVNLVDALPPPLSTLAGFGVSGVEMEYDARGRRVGYLALTARTQSTWPLLPALGLEVQEVRLDATVTSPGDPAARAVTLGVSGRLSLLGGVLSVSTVIPGYSVRAELVEGAVALGDLLGRFLPGVQAGLQANVTALSVAVEPAEPSWSVQAAVTGPWRVVVLGKEIFAITGMQFNVRSTRGALSGSVGGTTVLFGADPRLSTRVVVSAASPESGSGWVFQGRTDSPVRLLTVIAEYLDPSWAQEGDENLKYDIESLSLRVDTGTGEYTFAGKTAGAWRVPFIPDLAISADVLLGYRAAPKGDRLLAPAGVDGGTMLLAEPARPGPFGKIQLGIEWYSVRINLAYEFDPAERAFWAEWEGITVRVKETEVTLPDKSKQKQWIATLSMKGQTLGSMVEKMVSWATGEPFGLSAPWNVLNSIKLDGLELSFNFTTKQVKFTVPVALDLGFASLRNVAIVYDPNGEKKVKVTLEGRFLWVKENPDTPLDWDATDPGSTPAPPGGGNKYLDLRLLAMGQHVSVTGLTDAQTVQAAVAVLRGLKVPTRGRIPVGKKAGAAGQPFFAPESNWLIAADFGILRLDEEKKPAALAQSRGALDAPSPRQVAALESGGAGERAEGGWTEVDADPSRSSDYFGGAAGTVEVGTFRGGPGGGDDDGGPADGAGGEGDGRAREGRLPVRVPISHVAAGEKKPPRYLVQMSVIFNDPRIYALRIALDKDAPAAKIFKGLDFQIMYRRVTDTVGVYQAEIALPAFMRELSIGAYSITLPVFGIAVYTNGDFMIDVGFPWNQDFSRSFTIQGIVYPGIPLIGSAGFYFGKLSGDTATMVPKTTRGYFNPVIVFGLGLQVGVGKTIEKGILRAGFSVTVVGIVEGVLAKFNPYGAVPGSPGNQLQGDYYFWLQGTVGIIGRLFGAVDFAIIKAEVNVTVKLLAQITYESYADLTFSVIASVEISVSVEIDLGLFSFSIDFSFSARIKETFTLKNSGQAPWLEPGVRTRLARGHERTLRPLRGAGLAATPLAWGNLTPATGAETHLTAWLAPALTAAGDGSLEAKDQKPAYVAMLFLKSTPPSAPRDAPPTSFDALAAQAFRWAVAAATGPMTAAEVDALKVEDAVLEGILAALADPARPMPISPEDAGAFMDGQFRLELTVPAGAGRTDASVFPVPPPLALSVPSRTLEYAFRDFNELGDAYVRSLRTYFDALAVQVQPQRDGALRALAAAAAPDHSMAGFVFADYFRLLVRQMVQGARDALRAFQLPVPEGKTAAWIVGWVNENGSMRAVRDGEAVDTPFTLDVLFQGNADHALRANVPLRIQDAPYQAQGAETLDAVAARFGGAFDAAALADGSRARSGVLAAGAVVRLAGKDPHTVTPADTFASVAAALGVDVPALVRGAGLGAQAGLLAPFAALTLPPFTHTTAAGDTLGGVARRYGLSVAGLAVRGNGDVAEPWTRDGVLALTHLAAFRVRELLAEAGRSGGIRQLGTMASRYLLAGLRLPTAGITQKQPCACGGGTTLPPECGLYALTGQQFTLPDTVDAGFSFSLKKPADELKWVWLNASAEARELTVTLTPEDAARVSAVRAAARGGVRPAVRRLGGQRAFERTAAAYALSPVTPWRSAGAVAMTYGTPPAVPSLALWSFPASLTDLPHPEPDALHPERPPVRPRLVPRVAVFDEATGTTRKADPGAYAWGLQLPVGIKRIPAVAGSPSTAWTYELSGAGEAATALLERLVRTLRPGDDAWAGGIYLLYPPSPAGNAREGLLSDAADRVSFFVSQVNLSTETHPEAGARLRLMGTEAEAQPAGCWNTPGDFVRLLWENSITRSGGYFLYYFDTETKGGLPDRIFNDRGEATLTVLLTFSASGGENRLAPYMNCLVTAGAGDPARTVLFAEADPVAQQAAPGGGTLLALAARYYTDPLSVVEDNPFAPLAAGAKVRITDGVYEVRPGAPGGRLDDIARFFGVEAQAVRTANPQITGWDRALDPFTAVRLPAAEAAAGGDRGSLDALAAFYGAPLAAVVVANQDRAGLFAGSLNVRTGPVVRTSTVAAGTVPVAAERVPPQVPARPEPGNRWGELYLERAYSLLGWRVGGNAWFGRSEQLGLPVGPADAGDPAAPRGAAPARAAGDPWRYQQVVPAYRFAGGAPRPGEPEKSPYAGLGGLLQVDFGWQDLYGNRMLSPLQRPDLDPASPLNLPPLPVGYGDALAGPGAWPSVSFAWDVRRAEGGAVLRVELGFDPSQYRGDGTPEGEAKARANAQRDLRVYERLRLQLFRGPGEVAFSLESSLLGAGAAPVDGTAVRGWVDAVAAFVAERANGGSTLPPPAQLPLEQGLAPDTVNAAPLFELTASLVMARPRDAVLADFRDTPEVWRSAARVPPRATGAEGQATSLRAFAEAFEAALATDAARLKVASGVNRERTVRPGTAAPLWAVRVGSGAGAVSFRVLDAGDPLRYAPRPVSNTLRSRAGVPIWNYETGKGIVIAPERPDRRLDFGGVDVDVWLRQLLEAVDAVLSPEFTSPLGILSKRTGRDYLAGTDGLLEQKRALADTLQELVIPVLRDQAGAGDAALEAAREGFRQQLLVRLASAYTITGVVQFRAAVPGPIVQPGFEAPRLFGIPAPRQEGGAGVDATVTAARVELRPATEQDPVHLTFMVSARGGAAGTGMGDPWLPLALEYRATHLEQEIGAVPGIKDYTASSWLSFVLPPAPGEAGPLSADLGRFDVPLVLRAFPTPPSLTAQDGTASAAVTPDGVEGASAWDYAFTFREDYHYPQDHTHLRVVYNKSERRVFRAAAAPLRDLFDTLAEWVTAGPAVRADLARWLAPIDPSTTDETAFRNAAAAVEAFILLARDVAESWPRQFSRGTLSGGGGAGGPFGPGTVEERYVEEEQPHEVTEPDVGPVAALMTILRGPFDEEGRPLPPPALAPEVRIAGWKAVPVAAIEDGYAYVYTRTDEQGVTRHLRDGDGRTIPDRTVVVPGLNVLGRQDAWSASWIVRNAELVRGRPTADPFVYTTSEIRFASVLHPTLDHGEPIDLARVGGGGGSARRPLAEHLAALLKALFAPDPASEQTLQLEVRYEFALSAGMPPVSLPVLLMPPATFTPAQMSVPPGGCAAGAQPGPLPCSLAAAVEEWFRATRPSAVEGVLRLDLTVMSRLTEQPMPMLRLRTLELGLKDVDPPLPTR